ncbi:hypothetical protein GCM10009678_74820 [Actinomadura kijaniata]|uniref:Uncharacterized protein n=1 Tax=Actinomadura namibiensis TaxID=182080 RepID=A0A7W3M035_ACTNM|nr:hypothetical protein [Actinomadura namibiensis]
MERHGGGYSRVPVVTLPLSTGTDVATETSDPPLVRGNLRTTAGLLNPMIAGPDVPLSAAEKSHKEPAASLSPVRWTGGSTGSTVRTIHRRPRVT